MRARVRGLMPLAVAMVLVGLVLSAGEASAQCAMCRTALEQNGGQLGEHFNRGILFLLGMPYLVFATLAGSVYWVRRKKNLVEARVRQSCGGASPA